MAKDIDIAALRKKMGKNQLEFWEVLGVTQSGGSRYESGRAIPKPTMTLLRLTYLPGADKLLAKLREKATTA